MIQSFTQWINENSEYSGESQLADIEHLYNIGMISAEDLIRDRIKIQASLGKLTKLSKSEISLLDLELEEAIEEWVKDEALDFQYVFDSHDEEEAFDDYITQSFNVELMWQIYLNGTIDVSMFYPDLGPEQRLTWEESDGTARSRDILDYYKEPIVRQLDPNEINGRIEISNRYITESIQDLVSDLTNNDN
jgi:hypothetical protein